ncbi:hypothetical protein FRC10_009337 [Ceratobasidium sp. 414]|nr:hypothetical protein FRC10_009337 [Ceratobasidium sp. 414]
MTAAAQEDPALKRLRQAACILKEWKAYTKITGEINKPTFAERKEALTKLWEELGFLRGSDGGMVWKARKRAATLLVTDEEMEAAYRDYLDKCDFENEDNAIVELTNNIQSLANAEEHLDVNLLHTTSGQDLGVVEFAKTPIEELFHLLGLESIGSLPMASDNMKMQWHQLVGIATMLKAVFTPRLGMRPHLTLLCDDVGLGKTAQIIGTIMMLAHLTTVQDKGWPLPPLLVGER